MERLKIFIKERPKTFLFFACFLMMFLICLPDIIQNKGYFVFYGDYNLQEIPFYIHVHDMVRSGNFSGWDWAAGLGADFQNSYTYYCLTSPFFWLTVPFSSGAVPFLMPYLLSAKIALSAVFAFLYIKRFVKSQNSALIGAVLYAFSGFQINNIFYPDFNEIFTFFPLLLIALEELIQNKRRGFFCLMVGFSAILNYYFFFGQVIFCLIYVFVRCNIFVLAYNVFVSTVKKFTNTHLKKIEPNNKNFPLSWGKLFLLIFEGIVGIMLSAFVILPALKLVSGSSRDGSLWGNDWLFYAEKSTILENIRTMFMPASMPSLDILFASTQHWTSNAVYLPFFGMLGVLSFYKNNKKHWTSKIAVICLIFMCVPILNTSFIAFSGVYFRWLYMPILILCLMTAFSLEDLRKEYRTIGVRDEMINEDSIMSGVFPEPIKDSWKLAIKISAVVLLIFGLIALIPKKIDGEVVLFKFPNNTGYFWIILLISVIILVISADMILTQKSTGKKLLLTTMIFSVLNGGLCFYFGYDKYEFYDNNKLFQEDLNLGDDGYFRVNSLQNYENLPIIWNYSTTQFFTSTNENNTAKFYDKFATNEGVTHFAKPINYFSLSGLLSIKYYLEDKNSNWGETQVGFELVDTTETLNIYKNLNYIPMGFAYDYYITDDYVRNYTAEHNRKDLKVDMSNSLIKALHLTDEQAAKYADIIEILPQNEYEVSEGDYAEACKEKLAESCYFFEYDNQSFTGKINLEREKLVFFSVPYSEGWVATVNGKPAEIEVVDGGLMAVKVPSGDSRIKFQYATPLLEEGKLVSSIGLILFVIILLPSIVKKARKVTDKVKKEISNRENK